MSYDLLTLKLSVTSCMCGSEISSEKNFRDSYELMTLEIGNIIIYKGSTHKVTLAWYIISLTFTTAHLCYEISPIKDGSFHYENEKWAAH